MQVPAKIIDQIEPLPEPGPDHVTILVTASADDPSPFDQASFPPLEEAILEAYRQFGFAPETVFVALAASDGLSAGGYGDPVPPEPGE